MLPIVLTMLVIVVLAALVIVYVAYPHRGEDVPRVPVVGRAIGRVVEKAPVIADGERDSLRR